MLHQEEFEGGIVFQVHFHSVQLANVLWIYNLACHALTHCEDKLLKVPHTPPSVHSSFLAPHLVPGKKYLTAAFKWMQVIFPFAPDHLQWVVQWRHLYLAPFWGRRKMHLLLFILHSRHDAWNIDTTAQGCMQILLLLVLLCSCLKLDHDLT